MTDKIAELADAVGAFAVGPEDRIVISLPDADLSTIQDVHHAFVEKGFDMERVLILGGPGYATEMLSSYIYKQGLRYFNIGSAAAASWMFLLVIVTIAIVMIHLRGRIARMNR